MGPPSCRKMMIAYSVFQSGYLAGSRQKKKQLKISAAQQPRERCRAGETHLHSSDEDGVCPMETGITTYSLPREFYVLQINGRVTSTHRRCQDALRAGLLLKHQFPHGDIKVCEVVCVK